MFGHALRVLPGLWAGLLLGVALIAAPSAFAVLPRAAAGHFVGRVFAQEAWISVIAAGGLLLASAWRQPAPARQRDGRVQRVLLATCLVCTLLGYFAVQALLPAARAGSSLFSFAQLHLFSTVLYAVKTLAVLALTWCAAAPALAINPASSS